MTTLITVLDAYNVVTVYTSISKVAKYLEGYFDSDQPITYKGLKESIKNGKNFIRVYATNEGENLSSWQYIIQVHDFFKNEKKSEDQNEKE